MRHIPSELDITITNDSYITSFKMKGTPDLGQAAQCYIFVLYCFFFFLEGGLLLSIWHSHYLIIPLGSSFPVSFIASISVPALPGLNVTCIWSVINGQSWEKSEWWTSILNVESLSVKLWSHAHNLANSEIFNIDQSLFMSVCVVFFIPLTIVSNIKYRMGPICRRSWWKNYENKNKSSNICS